MVKDKQHLRQNQNKGKRTKKVRSLIAENEIENYKAQIL